jgi:hypothetical protein
VSVPLKDIIKPFFFLVEKCRPPRAVHLHVLAADVMEILAPECRATRSSGGELHSLLGSVVHTPGP